MPYAIPEKKIVVFFSPKSGGTSLRAYMFHLENGFPFVEYKVQGEARKANALVTNYRFRFVDRTQYTEFRRFALIRDPVKRFLSGYTNRVVHYRELSAAHIGEGAKVPPDPDFETFLEHLPIYRSLSKSVDRHFRLQQAFLGPDPGYYERVFRLEEISALTSFFNGMFDVEAEMPRLQTGGPKLAFDTLAPAVQKKVWEACKTDIAFQIHPEYAAPYAGLHEFS